MQNNRLDYAGQNSIIPHSRPTLGQAEANAARDAVLSGFVGQGERTRAFENALGEFAKRRFARATNSGTSALTLALRALDIQPHDEIILPAFVCRAVLNATLAVQAKPVLADIETSDLTLSVDSAQSKISNRTRLVIAPHMFGASAALDKFAALGIPLLEDAASSLGASFQNKPLGSFTRVSTLSFASTKIITTGQGGAILTNDALIAERLAQLGDYDSVARNARVAYNVQFSDIQAAIGSVQLARLPEFLAARHAIASAYARALTDVPGVKIPRARENAIHSYYRFVLQIPQDSARIVEKLRRAGIDARATAAHFLYDYLGDSPNAFPHCEQIRNHLVSLPIYPTLTDTQIEYIATTTRRALLQRMTPTQNIYAITN